MNTKSLIEFKNVSKWYQGGEPILKNINLTIQEGEFMAIVGFTGCGKTTLMNLISGLSKPSEGMVTYLGKPIDGPTPDKAVIFQNYSLLPWYTVYENIDLAVSQALPDLRGHAKKELIGHYIEMVNLGHATEKKPPELSGGMRQRVAIARALAVKPNVLLMDEPLGALDALTRGQLQEEILKLWSEEKRTVLLITNDVDEGIFMADRIIAMVPGHGSTLGPEYIIDIERPRDKKLLNNDSHFREIRTELMNFLIDLGEKAKKNYNTNYHLPGAQPILPNERRSGLFFRKAI